MKVYKRKRRILNDFIMAAIMLAPFMLLCMVWLAFGY